MDRICANHDIIIREGKAECPTCKEVRYPVEEIDHLRKRVEELEELLKPKSFTAMYTMMDARDRYHKALEEIEHSCDGCGHCKEDGFTGNCNAFIATDALREET